MDLQHYLKAIQTSTGRFHVHFAVIINSSIQPPVTPCFFKHSEDLGCDMLKRVPKSLVGRINYSSGIHLMIHDGSYLMDITLEVCSMAPVILCMTTRNFSIITTTEHTEYETDSNLSVLLWAAFWQ